MKLIADSVRINGPKIDGSYTISFSVGEYEQKKIAEILKIPQQTMLYVDVTEIKGEINGN